MPISHAERKFLQQKITADVCRQIRERGRRWVDDPDTYRDMDEIVPGLWLGNACAAANATTLRRHNITTVVNAAQEWGRLAPIDIVPYYVDARFDDIASNNDDVRNHMRRQMDVGALAIYTALEGGHGDVLVHCNMGVSRSTSIVVRYLMHYRTYSYADALAAIKAQRPIANPNRAFQEILSGGTS